MDYVHNGVLYHSGIKGMHWGVRKYRNYDGTLTPAGKERYRVSDGSSGSSTPKISRREARKQRKIAEAKQAKREADAAAKKAKAEREALEKERAAMEKAKKEEDVKNQQERIALQKLSNEELQATVNRLNLERQYNELVNPKKPPKASLSKRFGDFSKNMLPVVTTATALYKFYKEVKGDKDVKAEGAVEKNEKKAAAKNAEPTPESSPYNPANSYSWTKPKKSSYSNYQGPTLGLPSAQKSFLGLPASTTRSKSTSRATEFLKDRMASTDAYYKKRGKASGYATHFKENRAKTQSWMSNWADKKVDTTFGNNFLALPPGNG